MKKTIIIILLFLILGLLVIAILPRRVFQSESAVDKYFGKDVKYKSYTGKLDE